MSDCSNSRMAPIMGYPWPDPNNKRIQELESENTDLRAEVDRLRKGWMKLECEQRYETGCWYAKSHGCVGWEECQHVLRVVSEVEQ